MGGIGSTRWGGHWRRLTTNDPAVAVRLTYRIAMFRRVLRVWAPQGRPCSALLPQRGRVHDRPGLGWALTEDDGALWLTIEARDADPAIPPTPLAVLCVESVPMRLGGVRWWWRCDCGRRCGTLYRTLPGAAACRRCLGLAYVSQRLNADDRLDWQAEQLLAQLGSTRRGRRPLSPPPPKPASMRHRAYYRLLDRLQDVEMAMAERFIVQGRALLGGHEMA